MTTAIGQMRGLHNRLAQRAGGKRCSHTATRSAHLQPAVPSLSDRLQLLSWNPRPIRGSDPCLMASHLNGPWRVVCVQEGSAFCNDMTLQDSAVLLNKDTFEPNCSCVPLLVPCKLRCASWAVEGMVVAGKFRGAPDKSLNPMVTNGPSVAGSRSSLKNRERE